MVLLVARIVQASGTTVMMPLLMTTLMTVVAAGDRGRVMGNVTLANVGDIDWFSAAAATVGFGGLVFGLSEFATGDRSSSSSYASCSSSAPAPRCSTSGCRRTARSHCLWS